MLAARVTPSCRSESSLCVLAEAWLGASFSACSLSEWQATNVPAVTLGSRGTPLTCEEGLNFHQKWLCVVTSCYSPQPVK